MFYLTYLNRSHNKKVGFFNINLKSTVFMESAITHHSKHMQ